MNKYLFVVVGILGLTLGGYANAVPCGEGGVTPSGACFDGAVDDSNESLAEVNALTGMTWIELEKVDPPTATHSSSFWSGDFLGTEGSFDLAAGFWDTYSDALVVLNDGRTSVDIFWSAYELVSGTTAYTWVFGEGKSLSHATLFVKMGDDTRLSEPGTLGLLMIGFLAAGAARRRRQQAQPV